MSGICPVVAIAASAGGLRAIIQLLSLLPSDLPAAILVVQHLAPHSRSYMADILKSRISLQVKQAIEDEIVQAGTVYIAAPNYHLLMNDNGTLALTQTPKVNFVRPSANWLFQSVAQSCGTQAIAVVLTGTGQDGMTATKNIKDGGGIVIAQDEQTAEYFGMPGAAIAAGYVDFVLPLPEIAPTLIRLISEQARDHGIQE